MNTYCLREFLSGLHHYKNIHIAVLVGVPYAKDPNRMIFSGSNFSAIRRESANRCHGDLRR